MIWFPDYSFPERIHWFMQEFFIQVGVNVLLIDFTLLNLLYVPVFESLHYNIYLTMMIRFNWITSILLYIYIFFLYKCINITTTLFFSVHKSLLQKSIFQTSNIFVTKCVHSMSTTTLFRQSYASLIN